MSTLQDRLRALGPAALRNICRGIEKESLRVRPDGALATDTHPAGLGSALSHPHITTDFSESQLELITGVHTGVESCIEELTRIHQVVYRHIDDQMMWCALAAHRIEHRSGQRATLQCRRRMAPPRG